MLMRNLVRTAGLNVTAMATMVVAMVAAMALGGCSDDDSGARLDPYKSIVVAEPALDDTIQILNGPYLHAPAEGTMTVAWETAEPSSSRVELTPEGGEAEVVEGIVFQQLPTTDNGMLIGTPLDTYQHEVILTGLVPGASYTYRVLSSVDQPGATLVGPPAVGEGISFVVFGDTRTDHAEHANVIDGILQQVDAAVHPAFVINTGDLTLTGGNEGDWATFFEIEHPLISKVPMLAVFGNHEFLLGRTAFEAYFQAPPTSTSTSDRFYSADIGNVHIVVIDVGTMIEEPQEQWVEDDLAASTAPFKIVAVHAPLYTNSNHSPHLMARETFGPIFEAHGVQAVFSGHNHCYERFVGYGSYFITTGGGGAPLYGVDDFTVDNGDTVLESALSAYNFVWAKTTDTEMILETYVSADATTPVTELYDCAKIMAGEPVSSNIPCD
jgi:Calcineurin-like phosphoesterase/Purple acid Phosphatase, N-terminal domain